MIRVEHHLDQKGPFAEIIIDRPEKRNALTVAMLDQMHDAAMSVAADESARALVVRGEGKVFCSGFDLTPCVEEPEVLRALLVSLSRLVRTLRRHPRPVIIAAHGAALAGGCALLGAADIVVTHLTAQLGYPVVKLGISPAVSAHTLGLVVTASRARGLLLDPRTISGEEARRIGLAQYCVDTPEDTVPRAQIEAMQLAAKPPESIRRTKAWLNEVDGSLDDAAMDASLAASLSIVGTPEQRRMLAEALAAR